MLLLLLLLLFVQKSRQNAEQELSLVAVAAAGAQLLQHDTLDTAGRSGCDDIGRSGQHVLDQVAPQVKPRIGIYIYFYIFLRFARAFYGRPAAAAALEIVLYVPRTILRDICACIYIPI